MCRYPHPTTCSDAWVQKPNLLLPWDLWAALGSLGLGSHSSTHCPLISAPRHHTVGLRLQAAIKGIDLCAFGQSRIDVGQVKPSQRKIHVLS